jgi:hypothetical protein
MSNTWQIQQAHGPHAYFLFNTGHILLQILL